MSSLENSNTDFMRLDTVFFSRCNAQGDCSELLRGVSLTARAGEITAVIGPSGGGKSTLIRLMNRLADPGSGTVYLENRDIRSMDPLELRRLVALVPQKPYLFEGTVLDNLQRPFLYRQQLPPSAESDEVRQALSLARLDQALLLREARTLSGGEQQRVALARALLTTPKVLLLDEPTSAVDRRTADGLAATLQEICRSRGLTLVMVTHDLRLTQRIADYCYYLDGGRILEQGRAEEMLTRPASPELRRFLAEPGTAEP